MVEMYVPTPRLPSEASPYAGQLAPLRVLASEVRRRDAMLSARVSADARPGLVAALSLVNSYYSNRIEGNPTRLRDIERTLAARPADRNRHQQEHAAWLHAHDQLDARAREVQVGLHDAPPADDVRELLQQLFAAVNAPEVTGDWQLIAAACLHHRLSWIHPYPDSNGRVNRLQTDAWLRHACGLEGYGLWSMSRGFARQVDGYLQALRATDRTAQYCIRDLLTCSQPFLADAGGGRYALRFPMIACEHWFPRLFSARDLS